MKNKHLIGNSLVLSLIAGLVLSAPAQAHQGTHNPEPSLVCKEKTLGDACEWHDSNEALYIGSCRKVSSSLLCVRNKPIVYPETVTKGKIEKAKVAD